MVRTDKALYFVFLALAVSFFNAVDGAHGQDAAATEDLPPATQQSRPALSPEALAVARQGVKLLEQKKYKDAINAFLAAARRHPDDGQLRFLLGFAYAQDKQLGQAWLQFRQAVRRSPGYNPAVSNFLAMWESFDRRGVLNVGQTPQQVQQVIGQPDAKKELPGRLLWEYGFMRINFVQGKLYSTVDPRGLDASSSQPGDAVKLKFDGRSWKLGYRTVNRLQSLAEYVPPDESVQNWKELFTVQRLFGMTARKVSPAQMMSEIEGNLKQANPEIDFQRVSQNESDVIFQWRDKGGKDRSAQHEIVRLIAGDRDIHRLAYSRRVAQLPQADVEQWIGILQQAHLVAVPQGTSAE